MEGFQERHLVLVDMLVLLVIQDLSLLVAVHYYAGEVNGRG